MPFVPVCKAHSGNEIKAKGSFAEHDIKIGIAVPKPAIINGTHLCGSFVYVHGILGSQVVRTINGKSQTMR